VSVTGKVRVGLLTGDTIAGGGGSGLLKKTEKVMTFDGALKLPAESTAKTRAK
jgi:hypothetical protein